MNWNKALTLLLGGALALGLLAGCGGEGKPSDSPPPSAAPTEQPPSAAPAEQQPSVPPTDPPQEETGTAAALGSLASFTASTMEGETFTQDDIGAKDVTVINFWALTCGPCIAEMPALAEFEKALPDNVQLITVCLDVYINEAYASSVLEEAGYEGVTLVSGDGDLAVLCNNLMYTPTTVFADSEGNLIGDAVIGGQMDLAGTLLAGINQVLTADGKDEISLEGQ